MLEVRDLEVAYDGAIALRGISFHIDEGEVVALIGANGAGKTTTLKAISGLVRPRAGRILWNGEELSSLAPHKAITHAISHCRAAFCRHDASGEPAHGRVRPSIQEGRGRQP
jgi:branched-chain amino acid transport system ATP-binding protein